ncbi:MAG: hypothetical protein ACLSHW_10645 [Lachnospiraceae bacterium]
MWRIDNYTSVIKDGTILRAFKNSAIIAVFTIVIEVVLACMAAYPLSRNDSKFNGFIRNVFMGVMMIPPLTILVGVYTFLVDLKAINSYWGLILTLVAFGLPMSVFMFTNFISSIPWALMKQAIVDVGLILYRHFSILFCHS